MVLVEGALRGVVALLLAAYSSLLLLLNIAVQRLRKGAGVLQPTRRARPAVLDDPALGTHRTATVGVSSAPFSSDGLLQPVL